MPSPESFSTFSCRSKGKLPVIPIEAGNDIFLALIDSGSSVNIIPQDLIKFFRTSEIVKCSTPLKTVSGHSVCIKKKLQVKFSINKVDFKDEFSVVDSEISSNFQIILGTPFLSKFNFAINFKHRFLFNDKLNIPFDNDKVQVSNFSATVEQTQIKCFAKCKHILPPGEEKIIQLQTNAKIDFSTDVIFLNPISSFANILVGAAICENDENSIYVKVANFHTEAVHVNKGTNLAFAEPLARHLLPDSEFCNHVEDQEVGQLDHTDLKWDTSFDLKHLANPLKNKVKHFLDKNSDVFAASVLDLPGCSTVLHSINLTDNIPVKSKAYRVPYNLRDEMNEQINTLLEAGILIPSTSDYSAPVMLVKKADGGYRLAVDFRKLNKKLIKDTYPIPNINETIDSLAGAKYFSTLDLTSGFFQQVIRESDRPKLSIITHRGSFEFSRSPFGLATSPNAFQRLMNVIFADLADMSISIYIDDIAVASKDIKSHFHKLDLVFNKLRQHNLRLKPSKCSFFKSSIVFLGFKVENGQISPTNKNVEVINKFKVPNSRKLVRSFLGTLNYYRKFVPDFAKRSINLTNLTKEKGKFAWTEQAHSEFEDLKNCLASIPSLSLPDLNKQFLLFTDSSAFASGAVLAQLDEHNFPRPVAFASRKLKEVETRYSTTERELLAVVWAINYFKSYLFGKKFIVYTDHAALTHALKIKDPTSRIARWLCALADFDFETRFIKGKMNATADFFSRYIDFTEDPVECSKLHEDSESTNINNNQEQCNALQISIDNEKFFTELQVAQALDPFCIKIRKLLEKNVEIKPDYMEFFVDNDFLVCRDLREKSRRDVCVKMVVPLSLIPRIFAEAHSSLIACHMGHFKTYHRLKQYYYWPGMCAHVKNLVASCKDCLEKRAHHKGGKAELQRLKIPEAPMQTVHVDISGPYPQTINGNRFIVAYVCAFSKWPEAYAVSNITSDTVADTLADFISRHGCPQTLITDRGSNFISQAITKVYQELGIRHIATSPWHAAGNAKVERQHASISAALSHLVNNNHVDWDQKLKFALLAIRSAVHLATNESPCFILNGRDFRLPYNYLSQPDSFSYADCPSYCEMLLPSLKNTFKLVKTNLEKAAQTQENYRHQTAVDKDLKISDLVMLYSPAVKPKLCRKFSKPNKGPFRIVEKTSNVNFKIQSVADPARSEVVHVDRLTKIPKRKIFPAWPEDEVEYPQNETPNVEINNQATQNSARETRRRRARIYQNSTYQSERVNETKNSVVVQSPPLSPQSNRKRSSQEGLSLKKVKKRLPPSQIKTRSQTRKITSTGKKKRNKFRR